MMFVLTDVFLIRGVIILTKKMLEQAVELTKECWTRYWQLDLDFMLDHCAEDVAWVGAVNNEFMQGKDNMREEFTQLKKELKPCHLLCQEFIVMSNSINCCSVIGRYLVTTDDSVEYYLQAQQRCTLVWVNDGEALKINHIHVSNPIGEMKITKTEMFVNTMGKMAGEYMKHHVSSLNDTSRIVGTGLDGHIYLLNRSEVLYACAYNKYCEIHTLSGNIDMKIKLSDFLEQAGDDFSSVHRSYVINTIYIKEIKPCEIIMTDGSSVPLPIRRYAQIRDQLINKML